MLEIPSDYQSTRNVDPDLAYRWRLLLRVVFHELFLLEYIVTDFIYLPGEIARSFYVFSHGEATL
jgi:predicted GNAT superfamily acetyltransferase